MRRHVLLESMVPYQPRAVGCAHGARMVDLTQMDNPPGQKHKSIYLQVGRYKAGYRARDGFTESHGARKPLADRESSTAAFRTPWHDLPELPL
jgi:hypothetical protein